MSAVKQLNSPESAKDGCHAVDSSAAFGFGMTRLRGMNAAWHFAMQPLALRELAFCKMDGIEESEQFLTIQLSVCAHA